MISSSPRSTPSPLSLKRTPACGADAFKVCIAAANAGAGDVAASAATRLVQHKPPSERLPAGYQSLAPILTAAGLLPDTDAGADSGTGQP